MLDKYLPWLRRSLQLTIFAILVASPLLQLVRVTRQDPFPYPESPLIHSNFSRGILLQSDHAVREVMSPFYKDISGGPYALKIFPVSFSEPLTATTNAVRRTFDIYNWNATFILCLAIALGLTFLFGRVYCGYICPMSVFSSWNQKIQSRLWGRKFTFSGALKKKLSSRNKKISLALLFTFIITYPQILQYLLPPALFQNAISDFVLLGGGTFWFLLVVALFIFEFAKPGYFCRALCPTGTFLSVLGKKKKVHLQHSKGVKCPSGCTKCIDSCWLGLNPKGKIENSACDLCTRCLTPCPTGRITLLSLLLLFCVTVPEQASFAGVFDSKEGYHQMISERTFAEGELQTTRSGKSNLKIYYSFWGNSGAVIDEEKTMSLYIHILDGKEIFTAPIAIQKIENQKSTTTMNIVTVTHPISIGVRSLYQLTFKFKPYVDYKFDVTSPEKDFKGFQLEFRYPRRRL